MKKVVALLLIAVMALGFASCGKKDQVNTLIWYLPSEKQADTKLVCDEINKIIEPKIAAKIDIQYIPSSDFTQKLRVMMAANQEFDLCFTGFSNPYLDGARRGGFLEISQLLANEGAELMNVIPDYLWTGASIDGKIYAVPVYQAMTKCRAIYFNKALVDKYNFDVDSIQTMDDVEPFLKAIRDNEKGNYYPTTVPALSYFYEDPYRYQETSISHVSLDKVTKQVIFSEDIPEKKYAREKIKEWRDKGYLVPVGTSVPSQQLGCWYTDGYRPGDVEDRELSLGIEIVAKQMSDFVLYRTGATTTMTAISATSKYPEKAMKFLVEVNTNPDVFNLCAYGIEGKHYTKIDDTHIKINTEGGYYPSGNWKYGCMFNGYLLEGYADDLWDQIKKINDESEKAILLGFAADTTSVTTAISQIAATNSEFKELDSGSIADIAGKTAEYNAKLEASGKKELMDFAEKVVYDYMDKNGLR